MKLEDFENLSKFQKTRIIGVMEKYNEEIKRERVIRDLFDKQLHGYPQEIYFIGESNGIVELWRHEETHFYVFVNNALERSSFSTLLEAQIGLICAITENLSNSTAFNFIYNGLGLKNTLTNSET